MVYEDNFFTYLKWRGDLSVREKPFNEVDALILSELVYIHFETVVPGVGEDAVISIREANQKYEKSLEREMMFYKQKEELFDVLANSQRFAEMTLCNYVSKLDVTAQQQFAAMHINVTPNQTFIAFRGTDGTVTGWREDFNMTYMMPVPAQQAAVDYVEQTMKGLFKKYWFGGHSKGGNLAVYSAVFCSPKNQKKITGVYSFDGPGFHRKMVDDEAYKAMENRIFSFVPVASIVGLLMEHAENYKVVESCGFTLFQHEGFSWEVARDQFVLANGLDAFSKHFSATMKSWLAELKPEERKALVDAIFDLFEDAGIYEFTEIAEIDVRTAAKLLKGVTKVPLEQREAVRKLIKLLIDVNTKK